MPRLIDADELMQIIPTEEHNARMVIANAPTVEAEPVRHGRWIYTGFMEVKCSECSETFHELESTNYCPNCGAKMDEEGKDD